MERFPLPGSAPAIVAAAAPGAGPQFWAGAPCAVLDDDGTFVVGYRVRNGPDTTDETVIARSADGERYETVLRARPGPLRRAVDRAAGARAHRRRAGGCTSSCATPNTKHWWIARRARPPTLEALGEAELRTVFAGDARHRRQGPDRPAAPTASGRRGSAATCSTSPGDEDRMNTRLRDQRRRPGAGTGTAPCSRAAGDMQQLSRRTADDDLPRWPRRLRRQPPPKPRTDQTGITLPDVSRYVGEPASRGDIQLLDGLRCRASGCRIYYEARLPDGGHELRTELDHMTLVPVLVRPPARSTGHVGPLQPIRGSSGRASNKVR